MDDPFQGVDAQIAEFDAGSSVADPADKSPVAPLVVTEVRMVERRARTNAEEPQPIVKKVRTKRKSERKPLPAGPAPAPPKKKSKPGTLRKIADLEILLEKEEAKRRDVEAVFAKFKEETRKKINDLEFSNAKSEEVQARMEKEAREARNHGRAATRKGEEANERILEVEEALSEAQEVIAQSRQDYVRDMEAAGKHIAHLETIMSNIYDSMSKDSSAATAVIKMEGSLSVMSEGSAKMVTMKKFKDRWVVLRHTRLLHYKCKEDTTPIAEYDLSGRCTVKRGVGTKKLHVLELLIRGRGPVLVVSMASPIEETIEEWKRHLKGTLKELCDRQRVFEQRDAYTLALEERLASMCDMLAAHNVAVDPLPERPSELRNRPVSVVRASGDIRASVAADYMPLFDDSEERRIVSVPYRSTHPLELTLDRMDIMTVVDKQDSGWWTGVVQSHKGGTHSCGFFPSNYTVPLESTAGRALCHGRPRPLKSLVGTVAATNEDKSLVRALRDQPVLTLLGIVESQGTQALLVILDMMKKSPRLELKDRKMGPKVFNACFVAADAVTWLRQLFPNLVNRKEAVAVCQQFVDMGAMEHVISLLDGKPYVDGPGFYRYRDMILQRTRAPTEEGTTFEVIAVEDHIPASKEELWMKKGQRVRVLDSRAQLQWKGECNGVSGFFPAKKTTSLIGYSLVHQQKPLPVSTAAINPMVASLARVGAADDGTRLSRLIELYDEDEADFLIADLRSKTVLTMIGVVEHRGLAALASILMLARAATELDVPDVDGKKPHPPHTFVASAAITWLQRLLPNLLNRGEGVAVFSVFLKCEAIEAVCPTAVKRGTFMDDQALYRHVTPFDFRRGHRMRPLTKRELLCIPGGNNMCYVRLGWVYDADTVGIVWAADRPWETAAAYAAVNSDGSVQPLAPDAVEIGPADGSGDLLSIQFEAMSSDVQDVYVLLGAPETEASTAYVRLLDDTEDRREICRYVLAAESFPAAGLVMCCFRRIPGGQWAIQALGDLLPSPDFEAAVAALYGESQVPQSPATVVVTCCEVRGSLSGEEVSSDVFVEISFGSASVRTELAAAKGKRAATTLDAWLWEGAVFELPCGEEERDDELDDELLTITCYRNGDKGAQVEVASAVIHLAPLVPGITYDETYQLSPSAGNPEMVWELDLRIGRH